MVDPLQRLHAAATVLNQVPPFGRARGELMAKLNVCHVLLAKQRGANAPRHQWKTDGGTFVDQNVQLFLVVDGVVQMGRQGQCDAFLGRQHATGGGRGE